MPPGVVSRHLQPSFTKFLYRDITLVNQRSLRHFCNTLRQRPELAKHVRNLRFDRHDGRRWDNDVFLPADFGASDLVAMLRVRQERGGVLLYQDIVQMGLQLDELHLLTIDGTSDFEVGLFEALLDTTGAYCLKLEELVITDWRPAPLVDEQSCARFTACLSRQANLRTLRLDYDQEQPPLPQRDALTPCVQIEALDLLGYQSSDCAQFVDIGALFPNLRQYTACGMSDNTELSLSVSTLPPTIRFINLKREERLELIHDDPQTWDDIIPILPRFPHLESIYLSRGSFDEEELISYLQTSQIRQIGFHHFCQVSDDTLARIVELPLIRQITLDYLLVQEHPFNFRPITASGSLQTDWAGQQNPTQWGFSAPSWPEDASWDGLQAFFAEAAKRIVVVDGTVLAVKEAYSQWRREQLAIVVEQGVQLGNWSLADESDFTWQEIRDYMAQAWSKERKEHYITPPGPVASWSLSP